MCFRDVGRLQSKSLTLYVQAWSILSTLCKLSAVKYSTIFQEKLHDETGILK